MIYLPKRFYLNNKREVFNIRKKIKYLILKTNIFSCKKNENNLKI